MFLDKCKRLAINEVISKEMYQKLESDLKASMDKKQIENELQLKDLLLRESEAKMQQEREESKKEMEKVNQEVGQMKVSFAVQ